jgi:beta-glucosidase
VSFVLSRDDFSFIGREGRPVVEPGTFRLQVDGLNESIRLTGDRVAVESRQDRVSVFSSE